MVMRGENVRGVIEMREVLRLPEVYFDGSGGNYVCCSIFLDDYEVGELVMALKPCGYVYHTDCAVPWLTQRQNCCPL